MKENITLLSSLSCLWFCSQSKRRKCIYSVFFAWLENLEESKKKRNEKWSYKAANPEEFGIQKQNNFLFIRKVSLQSFVFLAKNAKMLFEAIYQKVPLKVTKKTCDSAFVDTQLTQHLMDSENESLNLVQIICLCNFCNVIFHGHSKCRSVGYGSVIMICLCIH